MPARYIRRVDGNPGVPPSTNLVPFVVAITGTLVDSHFFIADRDYEVVRIDEVHSVAGAGSSTIDIKKCTGTTAPASGTSILTTVFAADSTANTVVTKKTSDNTIIATQATRRLAAGDRLAFDFSGTLTAYVGCVSVHMRPIESANDQVGF
jgi:hypothetical protein